MELMFFSFISLASITISILFLISAIVYRKKIVARNFSLFFFIFFLTTPFTIPVFKYLNKQIQFIKIAGNYKGYDSMSKKNVILKINEDKFTITIEECNNLTIEGNYDYVTDYESFIFYSESCEIDFLNSNENQLILHTDLQSECIDLNNIIFTEY